MIHMFLLISSNSCPLNLLLVRKHQPEIKRLIQRHNVTSRMRVEPRSYDQGRRKNDVVTHYLQATLLVLLRSCSLEVDVLTVAI